MHQDLRALAEDVYGSPPPAASPASLPSGVIIRTYVLYVHTIHHPTRFLRREPRKYGREKNAGEEPLESTLSPFLRGGGSLGLCHVGFLARSFGSSESGY